MDTSLHDFSALFSQLGLDNRPEAIRAFIASHPLASDTDIAHAPFWSASQATFLHQALIEDADWAEQVDALAALLTRG